MRLDVMDCVHYAFECDGLCALCVWMRWTACIVRLNAMDCVHCTVECDGLRALCVWMRWTACTKSSNEEAISFSVAGIIYTKER